MKMKDKHMATDEYATGKKNTERDIFSLYRKVRKGRVEHLNVLVYKDWLKQFGIGVFDNGENVVYTRVVIPLSWIGEDANTGDSELQSAYASKLAEDIAKNLNNINYGCATFIGGVFNYVGVLQNPTDKEELYFLRDLPNSVIVRERLEKWKNRAAKNKGED